jgi:oligopeptide transport system ATP-binding protein
LLDAKRVNQSGDTLKESQKMQMIFQDPISSLNPRMTVKEIIGEGLIIQGKLSKKEIEKKVADSLELVGLSPEYASRYPHEFSGGQRQRIGVARALIMDPNVIIADEPISALDVSIRAQVINLLFALREKLGLTILFIAHDLSVVRFFCDRIAVMYNGKVVEMAPSEELFNNPMHPYTVSLLSAIPQPDPDYEKNRQRIHYNPRQHQYLTDLPTLQEIGPNHHVYANKAEFELMKKQYESVSKSTEKKGKVKA